MTKPKAHDSQHGSAEMISIRSLIKNKFKIPPYQRAFDWEEEHAGRFALDIIELVKRIRNDEFNCSRNHFLGTIVCMPGDGDRLSVVDGQQRLTSIFLFLSKMRCFSGDHLKHDPNLFDGMTPRLLPQESDRDAFRKFLEARDREFSQGKTKRKIYKTRAQSKMFLAICEFEKCIKDRGLDCDEGRQKLYETLLDNVQLVLINLNSHADAARLFETINNRGKSVSQLDLIKNYLIEYESRLDPEGSSVKTKWTEIERYLNDPALSGEDADSVLQATVTAMTGSHRRRETTNATIIREHIENESHEQRFRSFLDLLEASFECFAEIRKSLSPDEREGHYKQLAYFNYHPTLAGVLPIIFARYFVSKEQLDGKLLELIEKVNFRLYGLPSRDRADAHNKIFATIAQRYLSTYQSGSAVINYRPDDRLGQKDTDADIRLTKELENLLKTEQKNFAETVFRSLVLADNDPFDFYNWPWLKYFLARWESSLENIHGQGFKNWRGLKKENANGGQQNDLIEKEHIFSQKGSTNQDGSEKTPVHISEYEDGLIRRRLGNFTLCPKLVNINLSNNSLGKKIELIARSEVNLPRGILRLEVTLDEACNKAIKIFEGTEEKREEREVVQALSFIDARENEFVMFAIKTWKLDDENVNSKDGLDVKSLPVDTASELIKKELGGGTWTYEYPGKTDINWLRNELED